MPFRFFRESFSFIVENKFYIDADLLNAIPFNIVSYGYSYSYIHIESIKIHYACNEDSYIHLQQFNVLIHFGRE